MKLTPVDMLAPGMQLLQPVRNSNGDVLVNSDVELSERHIRLFRMWGVVSVAVQDKSAPTTPSPVDETALEHAEANIRKFFQNSLNNEFMAEVFRVVVARHAADLAGRKVEN